jgi:glycerol-3-phosphate acyltransferase PlsY
VFADWPSDPIGVGRLFAALVTAYLLGGIPWALVVGRHVYGIDPRDHGSGNLGATNVYRVLGAKAALATLVLDAAKGALAVVVAGLLVSGSAYSVATHQWVQVLAMLAAVLGHTYSPFIGFKGGKGVATSAGALFVITPLAALICLIVFMGVVAIWRMVSLGSVVLAVIFPVLVLLLYSGNRPLVVVIFALAALVLWNHRGNVARIARGEERKVSWSQFGGGDEEDR